MDNKIATLIRISEELYETIKQIAEEEKRSINKQIEFILEEFVKQKEKENN